MKDNRCQIDIQAVVTQLQSSVAVYSHGLQVTRTNCRSVGHGPGCGDVISARSPGHHQSSRVEQETVRGHTGNRWMMDRTGHRRTRRFQLAKLADFPSWYRYDEG